MSWKGFLTPAASCLSSESRAHLKDQLPCSIAGYGVPARTKHERTLAAQALLAGIAERGADAVGYAYRAPGERYPTASSSEHQPQLVETIAVPRAAHQLLVHVRDYSKGHASIPANNHPVRHGRVIGIQDGIIVNDDELLSSSTTAPGQSRG